MSETSMAAVSNGARHTGAGAAVIEGALAGAAIGVGGALVLLLAAKVPALAGWRVAAPMAVGSILLYAALGWLASMVLWALRLERRLERFGWRVRPGAPVAVILLAAELRWWLAINRDPGGLAARYWLGVVIGALAVMAGLIVLGLRLRRGGRNAFGIITLVGIGVALMGLWLLDLPGPLYTIAFGLVVVLPAAIVTSTGEATNPGRLRGPAANSLVVLAVGVAVIAPCFVIWPLAGTGRPPVVIISRCSWRTDHCGVYSDFDLTPNVDRFAQDGIVFEHAYVPAPWTFPSMAAMQVSKYPSQCGCGRRLRGSYPVWPEVLLSQDQTTLAEMMRQAGYNTAFVTANVWLMRGGGATQGYAYSYHSTEGATMQDIVHRFRPALATALGGRLWQVWHASRPISGHTPTCRYGEAARSPFVTKEAARFVKSNRGPMFLWVHYLDPHDPYLPTDPWPGEPPGWRQRQVGVPPQPVTDLRTWPSITRKKLHLTDADKELVKQLYDGEVADSDRHVGEVLDHLRKTGIYDEALIVVTADHGEELWDHDGYQHGHTLYDELIHVPLIVKLPYNRWAGTRVEAPVSLLDIGPTVSETTGVRWRGEAEGRSLLDLLEPDAPATEERALYAETVMYGGEQRSIISWPYKLTWTPDEDRWEMYDLSRDAGERNKLAPADEETLALLKGRLKSWIRALPAFQPAARPPGFVPDKRTIERLRALGYL